MKIYLLHYPQIKIGCVFQVQRSPSLVLINIVPILCSIYMSNALFQSKLTQWKDMIYLAYT